MSRCFWVPTLLCLCLAAANAPAADRERLLTEEPDEAIAAHVEALLTTASGDYDPDQSEGAYLYRQQIQRIARRHVDTIENTVVLVGTATDDLGVNVFNLAGDAEVKDIAAWWARPANGSLEEIHRLDAASIRVAEAKDLTTVVIGYPELQRGDVIGFSLHSRDKGTILHRNIMLAGVFPTLHSEVGVDYDTGLLYSVEARNVAEDELEHSLNRADDGDFVSHSFSMDRVSALTIGPFAASPELVAPSVEIAMAGARIGDEWIVLKHWSQLALQIAQDQKFVLDHAFEIQEKARELAQGRPALRFIEPDLFRFVRDDILSASRIGLLEREDVELAAALRDGVATDEEKAKILLAMIRSFTDRAQLAWVRSKDRSPLAFPTVGMFDALLIRVEAKDGVHWLDPACQTCAHGEVRPALQGGQTFLPQIDPDKVINQIRNDLRVEIFRGNDVGVFLDRTFSAANWHRWEEVPRSESGKSWTSETVIWDTASSHASLELEATGYAVVRLAFGETGDARAVLEEHLDLSYEGCTLESAEALTPPRDARLSLRANLAGNPWPDPMGENWILPAAAVYGVPCVPAWDGSSPFYLPGDFEWNHLLRVSLPEGWDDAELPVEQLIEGGPVEYRAGFSRNAGELVLERSLKLPGGLIERPYALAAIRKAFEKIREIESTPVVLGRTSGAP